MKEIDNQSLNCISGGNPILYGIGLGIFGLLRDVVAEIIRGTPEERENQAYNDCYKPCVLAGELSDGKNVESNCDKVCIVKLG